MLKCCICGKQFTGFGNNPAPLPGDLCCDECDEKIVLPLRIFLTGAIKDQIMILDATKNNISFEGVEDELKLKTIQRIVDGYFEMVPSDDKRFYFLVNEEGLLRGLERNELAKALFGLNIVGNMIVCPKNLLK